MHLHFKPFGQTFQNFLRVFSVQRYYSCKSKTESKCNSKSKSKCKECKSYDRSKKIMRDKVAIVTGGACGLGYEYVRECLRKGAVGVAIADVNHCAGEQRAKQLCNEFGCGRCIYIQCDVTKSELFDWTFKQTLKCYGRIDVVVNNAGILCDPKWEHSIATNIGGCLIGSLLSIQYMSKACIGNGGTVINISSVYGITPLCGLPIYSMTNAAIINFSRALGESSQYDRTGVKIITYCVGPTDTPMFHNAAENAMNENFKCELREEMEDIQRQAPDKVAKGLSKVIKYGTSGSVWVASNGCPPFEIALPSDIDKLKC